MNPKKPKSLFLDDKVSVRVWMSRTMQNDIKQLAQERNISIAALTRLILSQYIKQHKG